MPRRPYYKRSINTVSKTIGTVNNDEDNESDDDHMHETEDEVEDIEELLSVVGEEKEDEFCESYIGKEENWNCVFAFAREY